MKKLLPVLLVLMMCMAGAMAEEAAPTPVPDLIAQPDSGWYIRTATPRPTDAPLPEDPFLGHAVEIARRMGLMAESSAYYAYCNRSGASPERWDAVTRGDHTTPKYVFSLSGAELCRGLTDGRPEAAPWLDLSRTEIRRDIVASLPELMFGSMEKDDVRLVKMMGRYKIFAADVPDDCGLLIMLYEDGTPVICFWYSDRGAVSISAFFMPDPALEACRTPEDVAAWFAQLNMPLVRFEEVTW